MGRTSVEVTDSKGAQVVLYKESHALVIGVSKYTAGWPSLPGVLKDVKLVKAALEKQGFNVVVAKDLNRTELLLAFNNFINKYGIEPDNRLLFYFAGHGHTLKSAYGEETGYIVPSDAPNPFVDEKGFRAKALSMQNIEVFAKDIQSKHALFLFDSCFSGSIFSLSRAVPENITYKTNKPVRQFITAGSANEKVPDESIFRQQFIDALEGEGDSDKDGYLTGVELGEFLQKNVTNYSYGSQHPQYGKIRNPHLDKGDFVFPLKTARLLPREPAVLSDEPPEPVVLLGNLQVNVNAKARVQVNGEDRGVADPESVLNIKGLKSGPVIVRVEAEGYAPVEKVVNIQRGKWTQEVFELKEQQVASLDPSPQPQESNRGMVKISGGQATRSIGGGKRAPAYIQPFYMDNHEVTYSEYEKVMGEPPPGNYTEGDSVVVSLTWQQANDYCDRVGKRLPIESEWEMAGRSGYTWYYHWGGGLSGLYGGGFGGNPRSGGYIGGKQGAFGYGSTDDFSVYSDSNYYSDNVLSKYGLRCAE